MTGRFLLWVAAFAALSSLCILPVAAQDVSWTVAKASGEAWVGSSAQPASLSQQTQLRPGDSVRTGRNGRVLLVRGQETILVSPNSAISLPEAGRSGLSTVIQQAGTILLDVEKRNVQYFEVETPFLAAVVKGTRFRVSIVGGQAKVDVVRGQVQVTDFRSGDYALVNPQQFARSSGGPSAGLRVGGSGQLDAVMRGAPQTPRVQPLRVPAGGLRPDAGSIPLRRAASTVSASVAGSGQPAVQRGSGGGMRIFAPIGEVKLDIRKVTNGMARSSEATGKGRSQDWASRLQPGNGGNDARTENSGATAASVTGDGSSASGTSGTAANRADGAGSAAASVVNASSGFVALPSAIVGGGAGNGSSSSSKGNGNSSSGSSGNSGNPGRSGNSGNSGSSSSGGSGPGGLLGVITQVVDDLGLGGLGVLIDNRGHGNAYGRNGGNGVGKALGLGKKN